MFWTVFVLVLSCKGVFSVANSLPTPAGHLTPPKQTILQNENTVQKTLLANKEPKHSSSPSKETLTDSLARWFLSGANSDISKKFQQQRTVNKQQEKQIASASDVKAIFLAPRFTGAQGQGKSLDNCNPCESVPWVPMARSLDGRSYPKVPQYTLAVPTIQVAFPIKEIHYAVPVRQQNPTQQFHSPQGVTGGSIDDVNDDYAKPEYSASQDQFVQPHAEYGLPPTQYDLPDANRPPPLSRPPQFGKPKEPPPQQPGIHSLSHNLPLYGTPNVPQHVQQLPSISYGPPFSQGIKTPLNQYRQPLNRPSLSYLPITGAFGSTPKQVISPPPFYSPPSEQHNGQSQQPSSSIKVPILIQNPMPFPLLSTNLIPPMYPYQQFNDGKTQFSNNVEAPNKIVQNLEVTTVEQDDACRKCKEQNKQNDSQSLSAQHTELKHSSTYQSPSSLGNSQFTANQYNTKGNTQFEVMKSIPLAEFLASVEYPMQIIQAPILDVPDLPKYFDLGFQNFPHLQEKLNKFQNPASSGSKPQQSFSEQNIGHALFINNGLQEHNSVKSSSVQPVVSASSGSPTLTTEPASLNISPSNHRPTDQQVVENVTPNFLSSTNQIFFQETTGKPSQAFNVNEKNSTSSVSTASKIATVGVTSSLDTHSSDSTLPPTHVTLANSLQLPSQNDPIPFSSSFNTSSLDQQSNTFIQREKVPDLRYLSPPPLNSPYVTNWLLNSSPLPTLSPWASTPPRPFHLQSTHKPRFVVRPSPVPLKKPKLIHQIIVPYTTNEQTQQEFNLNNQGWTPLPPSNQARKVPPLYSFAEGETVSPNTEQSTHYNYPTGNDFKITDPPQLTKIPLSATGSDNLEVRFPNDHSSLNISPEIMNQILKQWPAFGNTGSANIQHIISENLQAFLNGEGDAVDFERLQKNIDNWTAEGFKQNSPSVNFSPISTITHLVPSKKIPEEYLTTERTPHNFTDQSDEEFYKRSTTSPFDYEVSASQNNVVKAVSEPHVKFIFNPKENKDNESSISLIKELNGWSLLDTKMKAEISEENSNITVEATTEKSQLKEQLWDKIPVSISPLTNEKVYVVTPLTQIERATDSSVTVKNISSVSSSRLERSYSIQRSGKSEKLLIRKDEDKVEKPEVKDESQIEETEADFRS